MKIAVIGLGYVGLSNAVALNDFCEVSSYDIDVNKINVIKSGHSPFFDTDIELYLNTHHLDVGLNFKETVSFSDFIIICTNTNFDEKLHTFDISSIENVISKCLELNRDAIFIIRSTLSIGCIDHLKRKFFINNVVFMPEFLKEGSALYDVKNPSRVIYGFDLDDKKLFEKVKIFNDLYFLGLSNKLTPVLYMEAKEAEAVKLFANTYLAMRVSFFNELDSFALSSNLNTKKIIEGICLDNRIGNYYNNPSFGYGGYCLPKDTKELISMFENIPNKLISSITESNNIRKDFIAHDIINKAFLLSNKPTIGIYRLVMKKNSDNFRSSSITSIIENIKKISPNIKLIIYEPLLKSSFCGYEVINDFSIFMKLSDLVVANRSSKEIEGKPIYCRDLFNYN